MNRFASICCCLFLAFSVQAAEPSADGIWTPLDSMPQAKGKEPWIQPQQYAAFELDPARLQARLNAAPREFTRDADDNPLKISLPRPDGTYQTFLVVESPVMAPELAAKFPDIKTYMGQAADDKSATIRLDFTPKGFHAQILKPGGTFYIDPYFKDDTRLYTSYFRKDYKPANKRFACGVDDDVYITRAKPLTREREDHFMRISNGGTLRTYRTAIAAQGEYTQYHGGTTNGALSAIVTTLNRITGIYERDAAIRLTLVGNNNLIIYTDAGSDPYSANESSGTVLNENQSNLDSVIGSANYDLGHVFNTGGGGLAYTPSVCDNTYKAGGATGSDTPVGDSFDVDFVAHEMGHQFGAQHSYNGITSGCSTREASSAFEPGSGSTIMGYAALCGSDDVQQFSDPYFHFNSLTQIIHTAANDTSCSSDSSTGNSIPTVNGGPDYTIPRSTPFKLVATGSDANGDTLTYCFEQNDLSASGKTLGASDEGTMPLFRSRSPSTNNFRIFPTLTNLLNNVSDNTEKLPSLARTMKFVVTVRDNRANGGGINMDDVSLTVDGSSGPFLVTAPNTAVSWSGTETVTWDVANTAGYCPNVNILLSSDGGINYDYVLATNTPNDGSQSVTLPNINTSSARIMVQGNANVFFDISNVDFTVSPGASTNLPPTVEAGNNQTIYWPVTSAVMNATYTDDGFNPPGQTNLVWSLVSGPGSVSASPSATVEDPTLYFTALGSYVLRLTGDDGMFTNSDTVTINLISNTVLTIAEALDKTDVTWNVGGNGASNWFGQTGTTHDGTDAGESGGTGDNQTNWVETTLTGPGYLTFYWQVSSELNYDFLRYSIDGASQAAISGTGAGWQFVSSAIPAGAHTVRWAFERDVNTGGGQDRGWLDEVTFTPDAGGGGSGLDISGYRVIQFDSAQTYTVPASTFIPSNGYVVIGRNATQDAFETFWGISLASNVVYLNAGDSGISINGAETFQLQDGASNVIQAQSGQALTAGNTVQRNSAGDNPALAGSWTMSSQTNATPGSGAVGPGSAGLVISEYSDATGTGNFIYEFVELYYDTINTLPPATTNLFTVVSDHGTAVLDTGAWLVVNGYTFTNSITSPDTQGTTQYVNTGWSMTGNDPASGSGQSFVMTSTNNAVLTWTWETNYYLDTGVAGDGSVDVADGWQGAGSNVVITPTPGAGWSFTGWSGSASGSANPLNLAMDGAKAVTAHFETNTVPPAGISITQALDLAGAVWTLGGNGSSNWWGQSGTTHDGTDAGESGGAADNQTNWVETTVTGPGHVTFWWQVSSEANYDFLTFRIDGVSNRFISGTGGGWQFVSNAIPSGAHTLRWAFEKDYSQDGGSDVGWLDEVTFTPDSGGAPTNYNPVVSNIVAAGSIVTIHFDATNLPDWVQFTDNLQTWPSGQASPVSGSPWIDTNPPPAPPNGTRHLRFIQVPAP